MKNRLSILLVMVLCTFIITASAQDRDSLMMKKYRYDVGYLRIRNIGLPFSGIMNTSIQADTVFMYNAWDSTMTFDFRDIPEYITCEMIPDSLEPKQEGKMVVTYNAPLKGDFGRLVGYFFFYTNESEDNKKRIILSPDIKEDFSSLTEEELQNTPTIEFSETTFDFGTIPQGEKITHNYSFKNTGKRTLSIRSAKGSCGCTKAEVLTTDVEPGETGEIPVRFDSNRKKGKQKYTVTVISNDLNNPKVVLKITGEVMIEEPHNE